MYETVQRARRIVLARWRRRVPSPIGPVHTCRSPIDHLMHMVYSDPDLLTPFDERMVGLFGRDRYAEMGRLMTLR